MVRASVVVSTCGITSTNQAPVIQDLDEIFITLQNKDTGNFFENNAFNTNAMNLDARISPIIAKEL